MTSSRFSVLMPAWLYALAVTLLLLFGCAQDPCEKDSNCGQGSCKTQDGVKTCVCSPGYEADAGGICTVRWRDKFLGTYTCTETQVQEGGMDTLKPLPYDITVISGSSGTEITFVGIGVNSNCQSTRRATAKLLSGSQFDINTPQSYCGGDPDLSATAIQGTGSLNNGEITLNYVYEFTLSSNANRYLCTAKLKRK